MNPSDRAPSTTTALIRFAAPTYIAVLAVMANGLMDTLMAGRISADELAAVGIGVSVQATVLMSLLSVLQALPPIIAQHAGAGRHASIGADVQQGAWIGVLLCLLAMLVLRHPGPLLALSHLPPDLALKVRQYLLASSWSAPAMMALRLFQCVCNGIGRPRPVMLFNLLALWGIGLGGGYVLAFGCPAAVVDGALAGAGAGAGIVGGAGVVGGAGACAVAGAPGFWVAAIGGLLVAGSLAAVYLERVSRVAVPVERCTV